MSRISDIAQRVTSAPNDLARNQAIDSLKAEIRAQVKAKGTPDPADVEVIKQLDTTLLAAYQKDGEDFAASDVKLQTANAELAAAKDSAGMTGQAVNWMKTLVGAGKDSKLSLAQGAVKAAEEAKTMAAYAKTREGLLGERVAIAEAESQQPEGPLGKRAKRWAKDIDAVIPSVNTNPETLIEALKALRAESQTEGAFLREHGGAISTGTQDASATKGLIFKDQLDPAGAQIAQSAQSDLAVANKYFGIQQGAYSKGVAALKDSTSAKLSASDSAYRDREQRMAQLKPLARDARDIAKAAASVDSDLTWVQWAYNDYTSAKSDLSSAESNLRVAQGAISGLQSAVSSAEMAVSTARSLGKPGQPNPALSSAESNLSRAKSELSSKRSEVSSYQSRVSSAESHLSSTRSNFDIRIGRIAGEISSLKTSVSSLEQRLKDAGLPMESLRAVENQLAMNTFNLDLGITMGLFAVGGGFSRGSMLYSAQSAAQTVKAGLGSKAEELDSQVQQLSAQNGQALTAELGKLGWTD